MRLTLTDIIYLKERDGESATTDNWATPIAFVINGEVAYAEAFSPPVGENIFLMNPVFTSKIENIDEVPTEIVTASVGDTATDMVLNEKFTSVLLSEPLIVEIIRGRDNAVMEGWFYDNDGFYLKEIIDGVEKRIDGMGNVAL
jgi:hypothetical protein